jgi:transcriptional regulator with XRE-family HTH domain
MNEVKRLLLEKGLKASDLYEHLKHLGVSRPNVTDWKSGRSFTYLHYIPEISEFLGIAPDFLLEADQGLSYPDDVNVELLDANIDFISSNDAPDGIDKALVDSIQDSLFSVDPDGRIIRRILLALLDNGQTIPAFANFLGVKRQIVIMWEEGKSKTYCTLRTIKKISEFLGETPRYLIGGEKPEPAATASTDAKTGETELDQLDWIMREISEIKLVLDKLAKKLL